MATETLTFPDDRTPLDKLLWLRFRREIPGLVEQTLAANPGLAGLGACPPRGTKVVVTLPAPATPGATATPRKLIRLTGA